MASTPNEMRSIASELERVGSRGRVTLWQVCADISERLDTLIQLQKETITRLDDIHSAIDRQSG